VPKPGKMASPMMPPAPAPRNVSRSLCSLLSPLLPSLRSPLS
jgi:hypothetical protein